MSIILQPINTSAIEPKAALHKQISDTLSSAACRVVWTVHKEAAYEVSGCFVENLTHKGIQVLSCYQDLDWTMASITIVYKNKAFKGSFENISLSQSKKNDLCIINIDNAMLKNLDCVSFNCNSLKHKAEVGDQIFFSGFEFQEKVPGINKGQIIYSQTTSTGSHFFIIDRIIYKGLPGGPIAIHQNHQLKLLGIIKSQPLETMDFPSSDKPNEDNEIVEKTISFLTNVITWTIRGSAFSNADFVIKKDTPTQANSMSNPTTPETSKTKKSEVLGYLKEKGWHLVKDKKGETWRYGMQKKY